MSGEVRIVFEEDGYPCELRGRDEILRALRSERLTPNSQVTVYRTNSPPIVCSVAELGVEPPQPLSVAPPPAAPSPPIEPPPSKEKLSPAPRASALPEPAPTPPPAPEESADPPSASSEPEGAKRILLPVAVVLVMLFGIALLMSLQSNRPSAVVTPPMPTPAPAPSATPSDDRMAINEGVIYEWQQGSVIPGYRLGDLRITLAAKPGDAPGTYPTPVLTVESPALGSGTLEGQPGFETAAAHFAMIRPSTRDAVPSVLLMTFSGGAHCCTKIQLLSPGATGWQVSDLGDWDGEGFAEAPRDRNKDGVIDFVLPDNRFLYTFASYADSYAPSQIFNLINGKFVDVSASSQFGAVHRADLARERGQCLQHQNSACAAMVASAARIGQADRYFALAAAAYDLSSAWDYPTRCAVPRVEGGCPDGSESKPNDFLQALDWFLLDNGYIKNSLQQPAPPDPLFSDEALTNHF